MDSDPRSDFARRDLITQVKADAEAYFARRPEVTHRLVLNAGSSTTTVLLTDDHHWTLDDSGLIRVWSNGCEDQLVAAYRDWRYLEEVR